MYQRISILGPGLLGGSLALALAQHPYGARITLWARSAKRAEATQSTLQSRSDLAASTTSLIRITTSLQDVVAEAELVILAVPVASMKGLCQQLIEAGLRADQLVTDVGSVKGYVHDTLDPLFRANGLSFLGSHPMAGGEQTGIQAADPALFSGAACLVTSEGTGTIDQRTALAAFWSDLGCRVHHLTAREHDQAVARVSHLPHLLSSACAQVSIGTGQGHLGGGGLRDITRLAAGDPEMWRGIVEANHLPLEDALTELIAELETYRTHLENKQFGEIQDRLAAAKNYRESLY